MYLVLLLGNVGILWSCFVLFVANFHHKFTIFVL